MKIYIYCDPGETISNIGIAKALTEDDNLTPQDLREISDYLEIYADNREDEKNA